MSLYIGKDSNTVEMISNRFDKSLVVDTLRKYMLRYIGEIRLLAVTNVPQVKLNADGNGRYVSRKEDFDGWVVLDGKEYSKTEFKDAYEVFGDRYGSDGDFFHIPTIRDFFCLKNALISKSNKVECVTCIPDHEHQVHTNVSFTSNGVIRNAFKFVSCSSTGQEGTIHNPSNINERKRINTDTSISEMMVGGSKQGWYVGGHNGNGNGTPMTSDVVFNTSASFSGVPVGYSGSETPNSYPTNNKIIAITYIGF